MAQHWPIEQFNQKWARKIEEGIRKQRNFSSSLKCQRMPDDYKENDEDMVFQVFRRLEGIASARGGVIEVHTKPTKLAWERIATNIYIVA